MRCSRRATSAPGCGPASCRPRARPSGRRSAAPNLARARLGESFTQVDGEDPDGAAVYLPVAVQSGTIGGPGGRDAAASCRKGVARARILLVALGIGLIAFSLVAAVVLARRVSAPLVGVAEVAHDLRRGQLQRRVVPGGPPEVREVGSALNQLAGRIGELLQAERDAAADLSHRLRTPVTALRLAVDTTGDPDERARLREHLDRLEGTVDAVVRQGRLPATGAALDRSRRPGGHRPLGRGQPNGCGSGRPWPRTRTASYAARSTPAPGSPPTRRTSWTRWMCCWTTCLRIPTPGTGFGVEVRRRPDDVELVVADDGPGLPAADQLGRGRSSAGSTGLGLDIVRRIAEATGAELRLDRGDGALGGWWGAGQPALADRGRPARSLAPPTGRYAAGLGRSRGPAPRPAGWPWSAVAAVAAAAVVAALAAALASAALVVVSVVPASPVVVVARLGVVARSSPGSAWSPRSSPGSAWLPRSSPGSAWCPRSSPGSAWRPLSSPGSAWRPLSSAGSAWPSPRRRWSGSTMARTPTIVRRRKNPEPEPDPDAADAAYPPVRARAVAAAAPIANCLLRRLICDHSC